MQDGDRKEAINILERYHETEYRVVGIWNSNCTYVVIKLEKLHGRQPRKNY